MKSIIFLVHDREDGLAAITQLTQDIKSYGEANHKLYFRVLLNNVYAITRGEIDKDNVTKLVGDREVIFLPMNDGINSKHLLGRVSENKEVVFMDNCMFICGDGEKKVDRRKLLIDWLLEKVDSFGGTVDSF